MFMVADIKSTDFKPHVAALIPFSASIPTISYLEMFGFHPKYLKESIIATSSVIDFTFLKKHLVASEYVYIETYSYK